jgi:hypothetical protein
MSRDLREAWASLIRSEDYDAHMAEAGQAQANAELVAEYLHRYATEHDAPILFLGAGTGQMFDYVDPSILLPFRTTFTDINPLYLDRLRARLGESEGRYVTLVDDIEESQLRDEFSVVVAVLVLEHVDWRRAVATISRLAGERAFVVIQENPPTLATVITPSGKIVGSMGLLREAPPHLVPRPELEAEFRLHSLAPSYSAERLVADAKKMVGLGFERGARVARVQ